jgi:hypothetical protein
MSVPGGTTFCESRPQLNDPTALLTTLEMSDEQQRHARRAYRQARLCRGCEKVSYISVVVSSVPRTWRAGGVHKCHRKPEHSPHLAGDGSMSCYDNHELATICRYANLGRTVCRQSIHKVLVAALQHFLGTKRWWRRYFGW